eukprot:jgi/Mesvir1/21631/Mv04053-RA.1
MDECGTVTIEYTQEEIKDDPMKFLQMTSVRSFDGVEVEPVRVTLPDWYDKEECVTSTEKKTRKRKKATKLKSTDAEKEAARLGLHSDEGVPSSSPIYAAVEKAVRSVAQTGVSRVYQRGQGVHAVYSAWTKHRHCLNVGREHASNNVWFSISYLGISQRCFDDGCAGYASDPVPMLESLYPVLFPPPPGGARDGKNNRTTASALSLARKISAPTKRGGGRRGWH